MCLRSILAPTVKRPILAAQTLPINNHGVVSMWMSATDSQGEDTHHLAMGAAKGNMLCVCAMQCDLQPVPAVAGRCVRQQHLVCAVLCDLQLVPALAGRCVRHQHLVCAVLCDLQPVPAFAERCVRQLHFVLAALCDLFNRPMLCQPVACLCLLSRRRFV